MTRDEGRGGWRPIETAEHTKERRWLYAPGYPVQIGRWYDDNVPGFYGDGIGPTDIGEAGLVTHWHEFAVPLPPAPETADAGRG